MQVEAGAQHRAQALRRERGERFEGDGEVRADLQGDVEDRPRAGEVCLGDLPGLGVGDVFVADTGYAHRILERLAELEGLDVLLQRGLQLRDLREYFLVDVLQRAADRYLAVEILVREHHRPVDEVAEDGHELAVVALLEVLPAEVVVLGLRKASTRRKLYS